MGNIVLGFIIGSLLFLTLLSGISENKEEEILELYDEVSSLESCLQDHKDAIQELIYYGEEGRYSLENGYFDDGYRALRDIEDATIPDCP